MKSVGIICEYNPFHNGHLYHLNKVKELFPEHIIILIMSGSFLQRGEPSIINKWEKVDIALNYGVDLVIELPYPFSSQGADIFAKGSVTLLNYLQVEYLVFGSESNDIDKLTNIATNSLKIDNNLIKDALKEGNSYPKAMSIAFNNDFINTPNDILGICYIREIININSTIKPIAIKRTNDFHGNSLDSNIVSATAIRCALKDGKNVKNYVPEKVAKYLEEDIHLIDDYFPYLKYKILSDINNLNKYHTVDEGIENRIKKYIYESTSIDDLIMKIKTKRYTYNKLRRMFTHILCNFTKEEALKYKDIEYIRVLGFSEKGRDYLSKIKKKLAIPLVTTFSKLDNDMLKLELRITSVYATSLDEKKKQDLIKQEYKTNPFIKKHIND